MELCHYGILGMKWGIRRTPEQLGHRRSHEDHDRARSKKAKEMSNDELKKSLERLRMENEYENLTASTFKKGAKEAKKVLANAGKVVLATAVTTGAAAIAAKYVKPFIDSGALEFPVNALAGIIKPVDMSLFD